MTEVISLWHGRMHSKPSRKCILEEVSADHGVTMKELMAKNRTRRVAYARWDAMWRMAQEKNQDGSRRWTLDLIAKTCGLNDHSSAFHGISKHAEMIGKEYAKRKTWPTPASSPDDRTSA